MVVIFTYKVKNDDRVFYTAKVTKERETPKDENDYFETVWFLRLYCESSEGVIMCDFVTTQYDEKPHLTEIGMIISTYELNAYFYHKKPQ